MEHLRISVKPSKLLGFTLIGMKLGVFHVEHTKGTEKPIVSHGLSIQSTLDTFHEEQSAVLHIRVPQIRGVVARATIRSIIYLSNVKVVLDSTV